jgi:heterodisulfide reductase subunit C
VRESPLDWLPGFDKKFAELTHRMVKDLEKCMQCGKCTAQCPAAKLSSYNPRQIIRDLKMGNVEKVISSQELWLCFFCSGCYAVCPQDINFPFAICMLRYAALAKGYGWKEVQKIKDPYAQDYYNTGSSVSPEENNIGIRGEIAKNSGTDGRMATIRKRMGLPEKRVISEKAMAEIRFISDATGMTDLFKEIETKKDVPKKWNYGSPADLVKIKRGPHQKFLDIDDEREDKEPAGVHHKGTKTQKDKGSAAEGKE